MVVYGNRKTKYVLSRKPAGGDSEGAIYQVSGREDILVKIYAKHCRTIEKRNQIVEAINGTGAMLEEYPIEMVYERGKFVGYVFEKQEAFMESPAQTIEVPMNNYSRPSSGMSRVTIAVLSILLGLIFSVAVYFMVFPTIAKSITAENISYYFNGVTMIAGGWIGFVVMFHATKENGGSAVALNALAYVAGCLIVYAGTWLIITALTMAAAIIWAVLPTVIVIIVLVIVVTSLMKSVMR